MDERDVTCGELLCEEKKELISLIMQLNEEQLQEVIRIAREELVLQ